eukprot:gnl/Dysnectes_brevis/394_a436_6019.p1 GENE.gnl/Dysnectes_brevis/394_a436_6019~~gnl/Dysnectes_brevis/394_a436_6019.p1  ORF type:complete len:412 (-),score=174.73 gnl/Dysnectes_brevis/394_a436_6019:84-1319(-)
MDTTKAQIIESAKELIEQIRGKEVNLYNKDWLRTWDMSKDQIDATYLTAMILEKFVKANIDCRIFKGSIAVSEFRDNSTRTRFSFMKAATMLGLNPVELDVKKSQISHGETIRETAAMISFLSEIMGIRDDKYIHEGHAYQMEVATSLEAAFQEGVLDRRPAVVNLQCDEDHPTQSMSDLIHLIKHFGGPEGLRGKKIAMCWAYSPSYGKPLSVAQSIITLLPRFGAKVSLAYPEGYDLLPAVVEKAHEMAAIGGGSLEVGHDMTTACSDAEVIYCKSWCPYKVLEEKRDLIRAGKGDSPEMDQLEAKGLAENAKHMDWTVTDELMKKTKPHGDLPEALYMHCLPADITGVSCEAGEVDAEVFERHRVATYHEAKNKMFVIGAMMLTTRTPNPAETLSKLLALDRPRRIME